MSAPPQVMETPIHRTPWLDQSRVVAVPTRPKSFQRHIGGFTVPTTGGYTAHTVFSVIASSAITPMWDHSGTTLPGHHRQEARRQSHGRHGHNGGGREHELYMLVARPDRPGRIDGGLQILSRRCWPTNTAGLCRQQPNGVPPPMYRCLNREVNISSNLCSRDASSS